MATWCQVRPCLHLAAGETGRNATDVQSRNAFSADTWGKTKAGAMKERGAYRAYGAGRSEGTRLKWN
jgi:hypothetical protein